MGYSDSPVSHQYRTWRELIEQYLDCDWRQNIKTPKKLNISCNLTINDFLLKPGAKLTKRIMQIREEY